MAVPMGEEDDDGLLERSEQSDAGGKSDQGRGVEPCDEETEVGETREQPAGPRMSRANGLALPLVQSRSSGDDDGGGGGGSGDADHKEQAFYSTAYVGYHEHPSPSEYPTPSVHPSSSVSMQSSGTGSLRTAMSASPQVPPTETQSSTEHRFSPSSERRSSWSAASHTGLSPAVAGMSLSGPVFFGAVPQGRPLLIYDWDDTLFPSTWLYERYNGHDLCSADLRLEDLPADMQHELALVEACALHALGQAVQLGEVVVISNGVSEWLEVSCRSLMPQLYQTFIEAQDGLRVISARAENQGRLPGNPVAWKAVSFANEAVRMEQGAGAGPTLIVTVGDAADEHHAAGIVASQLKVPRRTVHLQNAPTPSQIAHHLTLVTNRLPLICAGVEGDGDFVAKRCMRTGSYCLVPSASTRVYQHCALQIMQPLLSTEVLPPQLRLHAMQDQQQQQHQWMQHTLAHAHENQGGQRQEAAEPERESHQVQGTASAIDSGPQDTDREPTLTRMAIAAPEDAAHSRHDDLAVPSALPPVPPVPPLPPQNEEDCA